MCMFISTDTLLRLSNMSIHLWPCQKRRFFRRWPLAVRLNFQFPLCPSIQSPTDFLNWYSNGEVFVQCKSSRDLDRQYFDPNFLFHIPPPWNERVKTLILYNSYGKHFWWIISLNFLRAELWLKVLCTSHPNSVVRTVIRCPSVVTVFFRQEHFPGISSLISKWGPYKACCDVFSSLS